jgi:tRNA threonylcarbamoyladenosine modification (KEOPS) complex  Pcc1 subunit
MLGSDAAFLQAALETVLRWVEANWAYGDVWDSKIEILS